MPQSPCQGSHRLMPPPPPKGVTRLPPPPPPYNAPSNIPPMGGGLHHTMAALKLQHFQYNLKKKNFGAFGA